MTSLRRTWSPNYQKVITELEMSCVMNRKHNSSGYTGPMFLSLLTNLKDTTNSQCVPSVNSLSLPQHTVALPADTCVLEKYPSIYKRGVRNQTEARPLFIFIHRFKINNGTLRQCTFLHSAVDRYSYADSQKRSDENLGKFGSTLTAGNSTRLRSTKTFKLLIRRGRRYIERTFDQQVSQTLCDPPITHYGMPPF